MSGQQTKTEILDGSSSISTKVWQKAERLVSQIPPFFPLPGFSTTSTVGCWEAQASRFPAVQQPIWKGAKSLALRLPNFQATWQPAWRADRKPGSFWFQNTQILSSSGHLGVPKAPELQGNHSPNQPALDQDVTQAAPWTETPSVPLSWRILKRLGLVLCWEKLCWFLFFFFFFFKWWNHSYKQHFLFFFSTVKILRSSSSVTSEADLLYQLKKIHSIMQCFALKDQRWPHAQSRDWPSPSEPTCGVLQQSKEGLPGTT